MSTNHTDGPPSPHLFAAPGPAPGPAGPTIGRATVGPSGRTIIVLVEDGSGNPAEVASLLPADNVQEMTLSGVPAGGSFALSSGGVTTAPIPVDLVPPVTYGLWTIPVAQGVPVQVAVTWGVGIVGFSTSVLFEVFDGAPDSSARLAAPTFDQSVDVASHYPGSFPDGTDSYGDALMWVPLGDFTPSGDSLSIRVSAAPGTGMVVDAVRVQGVPNPPPTIADPGFESVPAGPSGYTYDPTGSPWTFSTSSGISAANSPFTGGGQGPPQGAQVAYVQGTGTISQVVGDWPAGSYILSFQGARRPGGVGPNDFEVLVDGAVVGTFKPTNNYFLPYSTGPFTVAAGTHTITFRGLDSDGGDDTALIDAVAVAAAPGTISYYDDAKATYFQGIPSSGWNSTVASGGSHNYDGTYSSAIGTGTGDRPVVDPSAIAGALESLPTIGTGGVTVSATGLGGGGPYRIEFVGPRGGESQPALTSSDPAATVSVLNKGGVYPTISINGGSPIVLNAPVWGAQSPPHLPYVLFPLPQSAPSPQYIGRGSVNFSSQGGWDFPGAVGYDSLQVIQSAAPSAVATWSFQGLPAANYQLAATWPVIAGASASATFEVLDGSGAVLATVAVDQTGAPADFQDAGVGWKVLGSFNPTSTQGLSVRLASGTAQGSAPVVADGARLSRTDPDTSIVIGAGDSVAFSAVDGWASTPAGPVAGATGLAAANLVGGSSLPPFVPSTKAMKVGYNAEGDWAYATLMLYANLLHRCQGFSGAIAVDANGYPTKVGTTGANTVVGSFASDFGRGKGLVNLPFGQYTVLWDGASDVALTYYGGLTGPVEVPSQAVITGKTGNKRVFNYAVDPSTNAPAIQVHVAGTTPDPADPSGNTLLCDVQNLRIYPPGIDPAAPPKFHPAYLAKIGAPGLSCIRVMDPLYTNAGNVVNYSDFVASSAVSYFSPTSYHSIPIATISGYSGSGSPFNPATTVTVQVTTTVPHGLSAGVVVQLLLPGGGVATLSDGSTNILNGLSGVTYVTSPTTFLMIGGYSSGLTMTNTLSGGTISWQVGGGGMAFEDVVDLANHAGCDLWVNVPALATDACATAMADYIAANLAPGRSVHVEYSNECWNSQFSAYAYCCQMTTAALGAGFDGYVPWYVTRASQVHDLFASAFAAAGRPASEAIRTFGAQAAVPSGTTALIAAYAASRGIAVDEVAVAPYFENTSTQALGGEPGMSAIFDLMTVDQVLDLMELNIEYGGYEGWISGHRAALDAAGFAGTAVVCYEGGPDVNLVPPQTWANVRPGNHAVVRHPRFFGVMLRFLQKIQDAGCSLYNHFAITGDLSLGQWPAYIGWDQPAGTGDPVADALNASDPEAVDKIKSEIGGAINRWAALTMVAPVAPTARNQLRATGYRRGTPSPAR